MTLAPLSLFLDPSSQAIGDFIASKIQRTQVPGMAILVVRDAEVLKTAAYGKASIELNFDVTPDFRFEAGSIGKSFTAATIMWLMVQGS